MGKTKIDWKNEKEGFKLTHTWNPVIGCQYGCPGCIAEQWNNRYKWIKNFKEPEWKRQLFLNGLKGVKKGDAVFVVFLGDLFGSWVASLTIDVIIHEVSKYPEVKFLFLTKNPNRYHKFVFPNNSWLGTSISSHNAMWRYNELRTINYVPTFLSIEPIKGKIVTDLSEVDWVIIGGMSGGGKLNIRPKPSWIESVKHDNIYYKQNVRRYL